MVNVAYIGKYNEKGSFIDSQWNEIIVGLSHICNCIIIYTRQRSNAIKSIFHKTCTITELQSPDSLLCIHAYKLYVKKRMFWDIIKKYNYNIDGDYSISHVYFMDEDKCIARLEVTDYDNFIILEMSTEMLMMISSYLYSFSNNKEMCMNHKEDIETLVEGELWMPLDMKEFL